MTRFRGAVLWPSGPQAALDCGPPWQTQLAATEACGVPPGPMQASAFLLLRRRRLLLPCRSSAALGPLPADLEGRRRSCNVGRRSRVAAGATPPDASNNAAQVASHVGVGGGGDEVDVGLQKLDFEREEAKATLKDFLRGRGLSKAAAARVANRAQGLVGHLLAVLVRRHRVRYLTGRELTTLEIRQTLLPYLLDEFRATPKADLPDVLVSFPHSPEATRAPAAEAAMGISTGSSRDNLGGTRRLDARLAEALDLSAAASAAASAAGTVQHPCVEYFVGLGVPRDQFAPIVKKFPSLLTYNVQRKVQPVAEYILGLGLIPEDLAKVVVKRPQLFGCSVDENLRPTVAYLESLGVQPNKWGRMLATFPHILTYSEDKLRRTAEYLVQIGISPEGLAKVIMRFPAVTGYSVDAKIKPLVSYLADIGISNAAGIILKSPQTLGLSLEANVKPTLYFILESMGFSSTEAALMLSRFPQILGLSISRCLQPKWEFFTTMGRPRAEVVNFPQFFGYSLDKRIRPRHERMLLSPFACSLNFLLSATAAQFDDFLACGSRVKVKVGPAVKQPLAQHEAKQELATKQSCESKSRTSLLTC